VKKILLISDTHCGHIAGLTRPKWLSEEAQGKPLGKLSVALWNWFEKEVRANGPYDVIIHNGDMIDGKGKKSGGTEQITCDLEEQCDMVIDLLRWLPKRKGCEFIMTYGTPYHTSPDGEDWENVIAQTMNATIKSQLWVDIEGVVFDLKHQPAGNSNVPHGRHTGVAKDRLWNLLHNERDMQPRSNCLIRSHVHHHHFCGGPEWMGMTTPALQAAGSKYGERRCVGIVDFGFVTFTVDKGKYSWQPHIAKLQEQKATTIRLK
jgi:hypothetical protein